MSGGLTPKVGLEVEEVAEQACEGFRQFGQVAWVEQILQSFDELIRQSEFSAVREAAGIQQANQFANQRQIFRVGHAAVAAVFRSQRQQGVEQGAAQVKNTVGANEGFEAIDNGNGSQAAKINSHQGALQQANVCQGFGVLLIG